MVDRLLLRRTINNIGRWIPFFLFTIGIFLLLINFLGLITSLRSPTLQVDLNLLKPNDITVSQDEIYAAFNSDQTDRKAYLINTTNAVHNGIGHYWEDEGADRYHLRVPFQENYILNLASLLIPGKFLKYEFSDYHRAIERGVGLCSEHAIILSQALYERGIETHIVGLDGHVTVTALADKETDEWWILDAGYGVVIPYDLKTIEENPKIIRRIFNEQRPENQSITQIEDIYGEEGNIILQGYGVGNYGLKSRIFEQASYFLIWIIPFLFLVPFLLPILKRRNI